MAAMSTALANALLNHITGNGVYTPPDHLYLALQTGANPSRDGTVASEVSGGSYARTLLVLGPASGQMTTNPSIVDFGVATSDWGEVTNFAICTGTSGDTAILYGNLAIHKSIDNGDGAQVRVDELDLSFS